MSRPCRLSDAFSSYSNLNNVTNLKLVAILATFLLKGCIDVAEAAVIGVANAVCVNAFAERNIYVDHAAVTDSRAA